VRAKEIYSTFHRVIEVCEEQKIELLLIAGNLFYTRPTEQDLKELDFQLRKIPNTKTVIIAGDQDYIDPGSAWETYTFESNTIVMPRDQAASVYFEDLNVCVSGYSYGHATYTGRILERMRPGKPDAYNILLGHGGDMEHMPFSKEHVAKLGFQYVALGHIHSSQSVGREEVRYAGSPLKYSLSEAGPVKQIPGGVRERDGAKQVPIVTVDGEGQVTIELEKLVPLRDLIHIRGTFTEIVKEENQIEHTEDFVYVTLTDEDIVPDAMRIMRQYYPNTIKLDYDNSRTRELSHVDVVQATQNRSYEELIGDFYKQMYGAQISEEEMDMMKDVAKEVGIYEAD
jgi:DNA repair exonuclease SbcCD nuclease subunit